MLPKAYVVCALIAVLLGCTADTESGAEPEQIRQLEPTQSRIVYQVECSMGRIVSVKIATDGPGAWYVPIQLLQSECDTNDKT